jgi:hypothetical protein
MGCPDGGNWHLIIAHPVCTRLANSGVLRLYVGGKKVNGRDLTKFREMREAAQFFYSFFEMARQIGAALCVENPQQHNYAVAAHGCGPANQIIQPHWFGDDASKATCLWLRGLPKLRSLPSEQWAKPRWVCRTCGMVEQGDYAEAFRNRKGEVCCNRCSGVPVMLPRWSNQTDSGQNRLGPSSHRAADRARTYPGIAHAMAEQWSRYLANAAMSAPALGVHPMVGVGFRTYDPGHGSSSRP